MFMLRLAACLEEHYPHSMANAVVEKAKKNADFPTMNTTHRYNMWLLTAFPAW